MTKTSRFFKRLTISFKSKDYSLSITNSKDGPCSSPTSSAQPSQSSHSSSHYTTLQPQNGTSFSVKELHALQHWSLYGQAGYDALNPRPEKSVVKADWKTKGWELEAIRGCWVVTDGDGSRGRHLKITGDVLRVLEKGFKPREMEDKWFVYSESLGLDGGESERDDGIRTRKNREMESEKEHRDLEDDKRKAKENASSVKRTERKVRVSFCRSWTGKRIVEIEIEISTSNRDLSEPHTQIQARTQTQMQTGVEMGESRSQTVQATERHEIEGEDSTHVSKGEHRAKRHDEERQLEDQPGAGDKGDEEEGTITAIIWDDIYPRSTREECQENAKEKVKEVCRWVLGVKLIEDE